MNDTEISELRVIDRSREGGHYVPPATIADNFYGNLEKLNKHFSFLSSLKILDTSDISHVLLAHFIENKLVYSVAESALPDWFRKYLPELFRVLIASK